MLIEIVNWSKYNPRNDYKSTPWFRLSSNLPRDEKLFGLSSDEKWTYVSLLCLAGETNKSGRISANFAWISDVAKIAEGDIEKILKVLQDRDLIKIDTNVRRTSRVRPTNVSRSLRNGTERNGTEHNGTKRNKDSPDGEREHSAFPPTPFQDFLRIWNESKGSLPGVRDLPNGLRVKIRARWGEKPDLAYWESCVRKMAASTFCCEGKWASFHWLMKNDTNHAKVAAGNYDNPGVAPEKSIEERAREIFGDAYEAD